MSLFGFARPLFKSTVLAGIGIAGISVGHAAPNACALVTVAEVSAAVGQPVSGGKVSVVNAPQSMTSSCPYSAGSLMIQVRVSLYPSAGEAQKEFSDRLQNSRDHDDASQKTTAESGVGEGAYSATRSVPAVAEWTAVHGPRIISIGILGQGATTVPRDRLRGFILAALGGRVLFMLKLAVSLRQCKIHAPKLLMRQGDRRIAQQGIGTYP